jgi:N-acetyl-gamma-glutamylphosphate reductase
VDERTGTVLALCAIDNLVKGAAGQAVQCANIMCVFDEEAGFEGFGAVSLARFDRRGDAGDQLRK